MKSAALAGINYFDFLKMTPKVLNIYVEAYQKREEKKEKDTIAQAYLISRWVWAKKIEIKKILDTGKKEAMSDDQMLEQVKILNAMFGGEVIKVVKKKE